MPTLAEREHFERALEHAPPGAVALFGAPSDYAGLALRSARPVYFIDEENMGAASGAVTVVASAAQAARLLPAAVRFAMIYASGALEHDDLDTVAAVWRHRVVPGGVLIFDDMDREGPHRVWRLRLQGAPCQDVGQLRIAVMNAGRI